MNSVRAICATTVMILAGPVALAQDIPKPGPEHDVLKKMVGTWDLTMKFAGSESKGSVTYKMELDGMWLVSNLEGEVFGAKFFGKGLDSYDAKKKKYVSVWFDSMTSSPMVMEGSYDKDKKSLVLAGDGIGLDGKASKNKSVTEMVDDDTMKFSMWSGDGKEPAFTILYKRKK